MATSMYLMQLRVAAQGAVVGTLSLGLIYQIYKRIDHLRHPEIVENSSATNKGLYIQYLGFKIHNFFYVEYWIILWSSFVFSLQSGRIECVYWFVPVVSICSALFIICLFIDLFGMSTIRLCMSSDISCVI